MSRTKLSRTTNKFWNHKVSPGEIKRGKEDLRRFITKECATPIGDRVLVKVKQKEIKTESGLLVAQTNPVLPIDGIVIAIGDSKKILCRIGDRVCFNKYAGVEVRLNEEDHIVMFAHEVLGVVE